MVHTNYDEYAIFLTRKTSRHHGPTITAKLYGKGLELDKPAGVGGGRVCDLGTVEFCLGVLLYPSEKTPVMGKVETFTLPGGRGRAQSPI